MPSSLFLPSQQSPKQKEPTKKSLAADHRGPLHGVPVTIKDMFETAGVLTTGGSKILADWVPTTDSHLVERLRAAGAIIIGKTNLDEFGHGGTSTLSHFGPVHNPWNVDRIAGGSSGGSAAAVAARHRPAFLRHRDRIVGAPAGILLRHHRLQADVRHH